MECAGKFINREVIEKLSGKRIRKAKWLGFEEKIGSKVLVIIS